MACKCPTAHPYLSFPVFGPQPIGPSELWPVYFVPDRADPGYGHWYCPGCQDGLDEAREQAGLPKSNVTPPLTWFQQTAQFMGSFFDFVFGIRPYPTTGGSR